jgi:hypothetical protein
MEHATSADEGNDMRSGKSVTSIPHVVVVRVVRVVGGVLLVGLALGVTVLGSPANAQECASDADCGAGLICQSQTASECTGGSTKPCEPNASCEPPQPPVCTDTVVHRCAYRACYADSDCGDALVCQPSTTCSGSASGGTGIATPGTSSGSTGSGTGAASGSAGTPVPPPSSEADAGLVATCTTSFPGICQPKATTCVNDADCPQSWTCVAAPVRGGSTSPVAVDAGASSITPIVTPTAPDAGVTSPPADHGTLSSTGTATSTATTTKICQPKGLTENSGNGSDSGKGPPVTVAVHGDAGPGNESIPTAASPDAGTGSTTTTATPPALTPSDSAGTSTATTTATGTKTVGASTGGGGCSVGTGNLSDGTLILLGLAAALALLRQKREEG